jgi:hypothetical protein
MTNNDLNNDLVIRLAIVLTERNGEIAQLKRTIDNLHLTIRTQREYIADLEQCNWYDNNIAQFNAPCADEEEKFVFDVSSQLETKFHVPTALPKFLTMFIGTYVDPNHKE